MLYIEKFPIRYCFNKKVIINNYDDLSKLPFKLYFWFEKKKQQNQKRNNFAC